MTAYEIVGVRESAPQAEVDAAARLAVARAHPDGGGDVARFERACRARDLLRDPARRAAYDERLRRLRARPAAAPARAVVTISPGEIAAGAERVVEAVRLAARVLDALASLRAR